MEQAVELAEALADVRAAARLPAAGRGRRAAEWDLRGLGRNIN